MGLIVRGLIKRGGVWWVRVAVPADSRAAIGKTELLESLRTGDAAEAVRLATPIIAKFKQQIANARGQIYAPPPPNEPLTAALIEARVEAWERRAIRDAEVAYINGEAAPLVGDAKAERSEFLYALSQPDAAAKVQQFKDRMAEALGVPINHRALDQQQFQFWFREAWRAVERAKERFAAGDFSEAEDEAGEAAEGSQSVPTAVEKPTKGKSASKGGMTLGGLLETFLRQENPPEAADIKRAWRLFTEFVGDKTLATDIKPEIGADFLAKLRGLPKTRKPEIVKLPFLQAIDAWDGAKIAPKTVWKTFGHIKRVFAYAAKVELIVKDPMAPVKNEKPTRRNRVKKRQDYDPDEIQRLFLCPLFTGFSGKVDQGYRDKKGDQVVKDGKFWLPILALWHGARQDEFVSARLSEIKVMDGITYFDWRQRGLKTEESARELPIHPIMKKLGWGEYVADMTAKKQEYLFPDLMHDPENPKRAADRFSKWFGYWQDKNGFTSNHYDFHAFRHTFQRACRDCDVDNHIGDLLTGRKTPGTATDYGKGASLSTLARALAKVNYPTFPLAKYEPPN